MCNQAHREGGVSVSVKDGRKFKVDKKCAEDLLQVLTLQIQTNPKDILKITALFKSPQMSRNKFPNKLTDHLTSVGT